MYIRLIRNEAKGNAITGRLVINGRWFCYTLERKGVEIPALCYHVCVTQSPKFKRLLPLVTGVPSSVELCRMVQNGVESFPAEKTMLHNSTQLLHNSTQPLHKATLCAMRSGIRFHRGSKPEHSTGCILVVADNWRGVELCRMVQSGVESCRMVQSGVESCRMVQSGVESCRIVQGGVESCRVVRSGVESCRMVQSGVESSSAEKTTLPNTTQLLPNATQPLHNATQPLPNSTQPLHNATQLLPNSTPPKGRTAADVEHELTQLILKAQKEHEEIILEVTDYKPGTEYGYNTPCPCELQKP